VQSAVSPERRIRIRATGELFQDGVLQAPAHTASLLAPYFDEQGHSTTDAGPAPYWPDRTLRALLVRLVKAGFAPQVHAIGDRAVRATLDDYAAVRRRVGKRPRLAIAHAELVDPADYGRFESLDVTPVMSFQWGKPAPDSIEAAKVFMGPERFDRMEPEGRLQDAGARIGFGSDWPVDALNELFALEVGVTRRNDPASGYVGRLNSDPGPSRNEAFRAITTHAAYEMGTERRTGSLGRGRFADFIMLTKDPMKVRAADISETQVLRTVVGGRTVYKAR
jgi:predicted amidohydrolase YtcJ